jgi:hypothetical protein
MPEAATISDEFARPLIIALEVCSFLSILGSFSVILTLIRFESMRSKRFMRVIAFIAFGDLIGNFPYLFPYRPGTGNWWCTTQGLMNLIGYPMGWLWSVVLVYFIYSLGTIGKLPDSLWIQHLLCWGVPIVTGSSTLFVSKIQGPNGVDVCSINYTEIAEVYHLCSYFGILFFSLLCMFVYFYQLRGLYLVNDPNVSSFGFKKALNTLIYYPIIAIIFWLPHLITELLFLFNLYIYRLYLEIYYICVVWKVLHGFFTALIFFWKSKEARKLWYESLFNVPKLSSDFEDPKDMEYDYQIRNIIHPNSVDLIITDIHLHPTGDTDQISSYAFRMSTTDNLDHNQNHVYHNQHHHITVDAKALQRKLENSNGSGGGDGNNGGIINISHTISVSEKRGSGRGSVGSSYGQSLTSGSSAGGGRSAMMSRRMLLDNDLDNSQERDSDIEFAYQRMSSS